jgi:hypothetical protein
MSRPDKSLSSTPRVTHHWSANTAPPQPTTKPADTHPRHQPLPSSPQTPTSKENPRQKKALLTTIEASFWRAEARGGGGIPARSSVSSRPLPRAKFGGRCRRQRGPPSSDRWPKPSRFDCKLKQRDAFSEPGRNFIRSEFSRSGISSGNQMGCTFDAVMMPGPAEEAVRSDHLS